MSDWKKNHAWLSRLTAWVDGDWEPKDRTLFVMEQRPPRYIPPTEEEHEEQEKERLVRFFDWYPLAAVALCCTVTALLLTAVLGMPASGVVQPGEGVAAGSWELELLGESFLLFLAMSGVRVLLRGRDEKKALRQKAWPEIPRKSLLTGLLVGAVLLAVLTALLGGIAGGAVTGAILGVPQLLRRRALLRCRGYAQAASLVLCLVLCGVSVYAGAAGLAGLERLSTELLELAAGISAACAVYGVCSLAAEDRD